MHVCGCEGCICMCEAVRWWGAGVSLSEFHDSNSVLLQTNDSEEEEEGSFESTNGEADQESSCQKSPSADVKSPDNSCSTSSNGADDEGSSPCSSQGSVDRASSSVPQQFTRVSKDRESTCARTELVYVHPTAEEKKLATATTKVCMSVVSSHQPKMRETWCQCDYNIHVE